MGKAIFQTEIIELGEQVDAFFEEGMFVLFGDNVPDTLKDFCHFIDQKKVDGTIKKGDKLVVDQKEYLITDRKSTRLNSSHNNQSRMPSSA